MRITPLFADRSPRTLLTAGAALIALALAVPAAASCPQPSTANLADITEQGKSATSSGQPVTVDGLVTGVFLGRDQLSGFYLQTTDDQQAAGMFVYLPDASPDDKALLSFGQHVQLEAHAGEFRERTQLQRVSRIVPCDSHATLAPQEVPWPLEEDALHQLEDQLVRFSQPLTVTGNYHLARYGSLKLAAERLFRPTNMASTAHANAVLLLDDGSYRSFPSTIPYLDSSGSRRVGSTVHELTGVLTHAFGAYRLHPTETPRFENTNPRPAPLPAPGQALRVASFNVENYFTTLGARGAQSAETLETQRAKLAAAVAGLNADILALVEVENNPHALADLVSQLSRRTGVDYQAIGGRANRGTDAIKLALIYRADRVEPLSELFADNHPAHHRPPVAAFFRDLQGGPAFGVITAHFKSKTGCPSRGDIDRGQGCWNERRVEQANAVNDFMSHLADTAGHSRLLLTGDLNAYGAEDPIRTLVHAGMVDLIARDLPADKRYTYVFRGESGYLDHALASAELAAAVTQVHTWPINADEPHFLGYDGPDNARAYRQLDPFRSSDHDPVAIDLRWP